MGYIYLYTGDGAGKTTNALGLALRMLGHNKNVVIIQFLKWKEDTGEMLFKHPNYYIKQFGRKGWKGLKNITDEDGRLVNEGLRFMQLCLINKHQPFSQDIPKVDLLILDEINLAAHLGLVDEKELIMVLRGWLNIFKNLNIIMTGRYATAKLINAVDFVNEVVSTKAPKDMVCDEGIQY
jgi:cob(I)alamin adenosyltransferase